jgi:hypothetical protein
MALRFAPFQPRKLAGSKTVAKPDQARLEAKTTARPETRAGKVKAKEGAKDAFAAPGNVAPGMAILLASEKRDGAAGIHQELMRSLPTGSSTQHQMTASNTKKVTGRATKEIAEGKLVVVQSTPEATLKARAAFERAVTVYVMSPESVAAKTEAPPEWVRQFDYVVAAHKQEEAGEALNAMVRSRMELNDLGATRFNPREGAPAMSRVLENKDQALGELDVLWQQKDYAGIVTKVGEYLTSVNPAELKAAQPQTLRDMAEDLFIVQQRTISVVNKLSMVENRSLKLDALKLLQRIGDVHTEVFRAAVTLSDATQKQPVEPTMLYHTMYKRPGFLNVSERERLYTEKVKSFMAKGGDMSQIKNVDIVFLNSLKHDQLVEYTVREDDTFFAAVADVPVTPGHPLLAAGGAVKSAGSMRLYRDDAGDISTIVVGSFSGHFMSGRESQHHVVRHLRNMGVAREKIILQEDEAGRARTVDILSKLIGEEGAAAQARAERVLEQSQVWR